MTPQATTPTQTMQGQIVPVSSVNPVEFFRGTRRQRLIQSNAAWAGLGFTDTVKIFRAGIISELHVQLVGTAVVTLGGGTAATTARWPYDIMKSCRFSANGQTNLISVSGNKLKAYEMMRNTDLTDRGVTQGFTGASPGTATSQGTLSMHSESWGLGSAVTAIVGAPTTYNFNLAWIVPVAYDQKSLAGAIFAQTSSTDLNLMIDWAAATDLFVLTGAATIVLAATLKVLATVYSIPSNPQGGIWVPDLSAFHALQQSRVPATAGSADYSLAGQGVGRQLLRIFLQVWDNTTKLPLAVTDAIFGQFGLRYGVNDTPENLGSATMAAQVAERTFNCDIGAVWGYLALDFVSEFAFRDSIDEGTASEIRFLLEILTLTNPSTVEYVQETLAAGVAA